jgi:hypothetical protein
LNNYIYIAEVEENKKDSKANSGEINTMEIAK